MSQNVRPQRSTVKKEKLTIALTTNSRCGRAGGFVTQRIASVGVEIVGVHVHDRLRHAVVREQDDENPLDYCRVILRAQGREG
jgi:hypothetical protein